MTYFSELEAAVSHRLRSTETLDRRALDSDYGVELPITSTTRAVLS